MITLRFFLSISLCLVLGVMCSNSIAQETSHRNCGTMDHIEFLREADPKIDSRMNRIERFTQDYVSRNARQSGTIYTIPVVVHVVYNNGTENISDAQVQSQIDILNEDFRRLNADADGTWSQAADTEIEFCLASVDPNGNSTNGITRTNSSVSAFSTNDAMKFTSSGGRDAWPASDYLNMWSCDISGGILGYAQFPGGSDATDGVVMDYQYFGNIGTATAPFDLGRTATHEVGHWLNLRHIWGDGGCSVDDFVSDTPTSDAANYGCATGHSSCSSTDMVQNYMDYSDDACMNLFTQGQTDRMRALFAPGGAKASLLSSGGCGSPAAPTCDDGFQNGNETGVDCGGPECNACPTCDDSTMNGDETGVDCGGSCGPCPCLGNDVSVTINLDNYPEETTWSITDDAGSTLASGGTYGSQPDGSTVVEATCVPDGCFTFTINDSYGDGICCDYGTGSYSVTDGDGNSLASGASFASSESTEFCFSGAPTPTCDDNTMNGDETGVDCGGSCDACPTCDDNMMNGDETGVDCGGSCDACPTCDDNIMNGDETGIDCGGLFCKACETGCSDVTINSNDFESGWGIWNDGGSDSRRNFASSRANSGSYTIRLRDNTSTSVMTTDVMDLSSFDEISVDFHYLARSMDNANEDFWLMISTDNGSSYTIIDRWNQGDEFENLVPNEDLVTIQGPFSSQTKLRFRCDASGNGDYVYIDDVVLTGCSNSNRTGEPLLISDIISEESTSISKVSSAQINIPTVGELSVYPNPAKDQVNLTFDLSIDAQVQYSISDITGKVIEMNTMNLNAGEHNLQRNISDLNAGIYLVNIIANGQKTSKKLIILQ